ncbi:GFA family protein [Shewanella sp. KT0246]|uniref:GFA family protein n=1 Tax=Shewanella sp. KT0246 TaxID=2815912 RepID=UPI001BC6DEDF|nr:GFA family protein [Shewanella sp. KT0246]GIU53783.1 aldehyde-activating protein [Shewanella sp. KT0246]
MGKQAANTHDSLLLEGGCLCGAVRYQLTAEPFDADYCHCKQCQKSSGAVFQAWMDFKIEQVIWVKGEVTEYKSSDYVRRGFCKQCGCNLSFRDTRYPDYFTLTIGSLDNPSLIKPNYHIYTANQVSWLTITDDCNRYEQERIT